MTELFAQYAAAVTVTDGAWGTQLQKQSLPAGACPDLWNLENPAAVEAVAREYVQAGSQIILTNTFRSNRFALEHWQLGDQAAKLAEVGAAISRKVAGNSARVFGSMAPTGKIVMMGDTPKEDIYAAFAEQAKALARGGVDAILCETFTELEEALLAARAARENTALPVLVSLTFDSGPDRAATMMGNSPADLAKAARELGLSAVGANCGAGPDNLVKVARLFRQATDLPILVKPNAGLPVIRDGQTVFPLAPAQFAAFVPELVAAGANFIGGCCGTTPDHIRAVQAAVKSLKR
jgi:5-methyltetrahydrofolate--homocysteine methyltransferase